MTNFMANEGARAADSGFHVMPTIARDKAPGKWFNGQWQPMHDWERFCERPATEIEIDTWSQWPECSVSIAGGTVTGIDIDIDDLALSNRVRAVAERVLGVTPLIRYGRPGRMMMVYRSAVPMRGWNIGPIQIIGMGRQFVAFGIHPNTGQPYRWEGDTPADTALATLPNIDEARVRLFADEALAVLPLDMRTTKVRTAREGGVASDNEPATREAIESAVASIPTGGDYEYFLQIGMGIHAALEGDGLDIWDAWCSKSEHYNSDGLKKKWASFGNRGGHIITAGTIFHEARLFGWVPPAGMHLTKREAAEASMPHPAQALLDKIMAGHVTGGTRADPPPPVATEPKPATKKAPAEPRPPAAPSEPAWVQGLDGGLAMWTSRCVATARKPQPWVTLGAALALFGAVAGRRYQGPTGVRSNIYAIGLCGTAGGKGHPLSWVQESLIQAGLHNVLGSSDIASGAALVSTLEAQPNVVYPLDEVDGLIRAATDRGRHAQQRFQEVNKHLLTFFTSSHTTYLGTDYANKKERPRTVIVQPSLSIFGVTTPERFWQALQSGSALDGTLGRMLVFETDQPYPYPVENGGSTVIPADIIELLQRIDRGADGHETFPMGNAPAAVPKPYQLGYASKDAKDFAWAMAMEETDLCRQHEGRPTVALYGRTVEQVQKIALIRAVANNPERPQLHLEDLEWAKLVYGLVIQNMARGLNERVADNDHELALKAVARAVKSCSEASGEGAATLSQVARLCRTIPQRQRAELLAQLVDMGDVQEITAMEPGKGGRPAKYYRWVGE